MTEEEILNLKSLYNIYTGILFNNDDFNQETKNNIIYEYPNELKKLKSLYNIDKIAGYGTEFERGLKLVRYFHKRLKHLSTFKNNIPCNSLDLLEYSLNNQEHGINCLNKSKILQEMLLCLGIKARRVSIRPYSPYDWDSHVVCELYDNKYNKWIMLDMSMNVYFIDEHLTPLSVKEIRNNMKNQKIVTAIFENQSTDDLEKLFEINIQTNVYFAKNLFMFSFDEYSTFGPCDRQLYYVPKNFNLREYFERNLEFKAKNCIIKDDFDKNFIDYCKIHFENLVKNDFVYIDEKEV